MDEAKARILLVDDERSNLTILGSLLGEFFDLDAVLDGESALKRAVATPQPDLILLDVAMPVMDGLEVCRRLKSDGRTRHIPVIIVSGKREKEDVVRGFEAGGVDYVTKPFNSAELLARVRTHIEVKTLRSLIPICTCCKKLRDEKAGWERIEAYFTKHSELLFSHGICPKCTEKRHGEDVS